MWILVAGSTSIASAHPPTTESYSYWVEVEKTRQIPAYNYRDQRVRVAPFSKVVQVSVYNYENRRSCHPFAGCSTVRVRVAPFTKSKTVVAYNYETKKVRVAPFTRPYTYTGYEKKTGIRQVHDPHYEPPAPAATAAPEPTAQPQPPAPAATAAPEPTAQPQPPAPAATAAPEPTGKPLPPAPEPTASPTQTPTNSAQPNHPDYKPPPRPQTCPPGSTPNADVTQDVYVGHDRSGNKVTYTDPNSVTDRYVILSSKRAAWEKIDSSRNCYRAVVPANSANQAGRGINWGAIADAVVDGFWQADRVAYHLICNRKGTRSASATVARSVQAAAQNSAFEALKAKAAAAGGAAGVTSYVLINDACKRSEQRHYPDNPSPQPDLPSNPSDSSDDDNSDDTTSSPPPPPPPTATATPDPAPVTLADFHAAVARMRRGEITYAEMLAVKRAYQCAQGVTTLCG